jgi:fructoselysine-6-P-deglycase FrlB-like protein
VRRALPERGARVAVVGCGTSYFMAQSFAALRETAGEGETDAFPASEFPAHRPYDRVVALTRSGTTTEVLRVLEAVRWRATVLTTAVDLPAAHTADAPIVLDFADERSVVQTRFATTALALWRAWLGEDLRAAIGDAVVALTVPVERFVQRREFTFLGTGWTVGLAHEAALKLREAAQAWTESYPAMEFRHGPVSVIDGSSVVWVFGDAPTGLVDELTDTHALIEQSTLDPMAHLVTAQRVAVAVAERRGLNPDTPRHLTRSIVLTG